MPHEAARRATGDDVPVLSRLTRAAIAELRPQRGGELWFRQYGRPEPLEDGLARACADPGRFVVVGTVDGVEIGRAHV